MKTIIAFIFIVFTYQINCAQNSFNHSTNDNSVVMTWNKNTPDKEMKDDIKALKANNGVMIKYSNLKRNSNSEITNIKIEYSDNEGNSGSQEYNNINAIPEIKFYKHNDEIGFGNPDNNFLNDGNAFQNFDLNDLKKQFSNRIKIDTLGNNNSFSFDLTDENKSKISKKSKIIIQKDGRKPLVIEDGKVIGGANDYSKEEIEKILNENKINADGSNEIKSFSFDIDGDNIDMKNLQQQIKKMQDQIEKMIPNVNENEVSPRISKPSKSEQENLKKEMDHVKDEMTKAKKEIEEAKKELQRAKNEMKTQKI